MRATRARMKSRWTRWIDGETKMEPYELRENDHEALQGFWKLISVTANGQPLANANVGTVFRFVGNRFIHIRSRISSRFELHAGGDPQSFDLVDVSTRNRVRQLYKLEGDMLEIQTNSLNLPRVREFGHPVYPLETYSRFKRRLSIKPRVKALVPTECIAEGILPKGVKLSELLQKKR